MAADKAGFKYTWASEHHFLTEYSHLSASESFLAFVRRQDEQHPHRLGHLQHHAAGEPPGPDRRAGGHARPPLRGPLRVRHRPGLVHHRAAGLRHQRPRPHPRDGGRDPARRSCACGRTRTTATTASSSPCRRATSCPSPTPSPTRRSGWRPAAPPPSTWPPSWASASCASASPRRTSSPRWSARYKEKIEDCTNPVGGFVNNNVMITTQMICMEDGAKARKTFLDADSNYHLSLVFRYLDTFPKPPGIPEWPEIIPAMDAADARRRHRAGRHRRRRPRRGGQGHRELRRRPVPTSWPSACCRPPCRSRRARRPSRRSASTC